MSTHIAASIAVDEHAVYGCSPVWDSGFSSLLWVDVPAKAVHRYFPGGDDHVLTVPQSVSAALPRSAGGLLLHLNEGIALFEPREEIRTWLVYWAREGVGPAATAVDGRGRLWAGTRGDSSGWLARVEPTGSAKVMLDAQQGYDGLTWSPEEDRLYLSDSAAGHISVFGFDAELGDISEVHQRIELDSAPGGLCTDADGCLWVAMSQRPEIRRYTPDGTLDRTVVLPSQRPTGCCFGGDELTDLYVTTARDGLSAPHDCDGAVLVLPDAGQGRRTYSFAG